MEWSNVDSSAQRLLTCPVSNIKGWMPYTGTWWVNMTACCRQRPFFKIYGQFKGGQMRRYKAACVCTVMLGLVEMGNVEEDYNRGQLQSTCLTDHSVSLSSYMKFQQ